MGNQTSRQPGLMQPGKSDTKAVWLDPTREFKEEEKVLEDYLTDGKAPLGALENPRLLRHGTSSSINAQPRNAEYLFP
jgi:hypothetical protein